MLGTPNNTIMNEILVMYRLTVISLRIVWFKFNNNVMNNDF